MALDLHPDLGKFCLTKLPGGQASREEDGRGGAGDDSAVGDAGRRKKIAAKRAETHCTTRKNNCRRRRTRAACKQRRKRLSVFLGPFCVRDGDSIDTLRRTRAPLPHADEG